MANKSKELKGKRLVYVSEELIHDISDIAKKRGETISKFVEDAVQLAIRIHDIGLSLEKAAEALEVIHAQRALGGVFVPQVALDFMVESIHKSGWDELLKRWHEGGKLHGRYLRERFSNPLKALKNLLEFIRWDLNEVDIYYNKEYMCLRCISTALSLEATELLCKFLEGAIKGLGYEIYGMEYLRGMIIINFKP